AIGSHRHFPRASDPERFHPTNIHYGLFPPLEKRVRGKRERHEKIFRRAEEAFGSFARTL
ncbi:MAG: methylenetetrahydrofolate--tRNA-(uracil(54)-C(5))-methyltransferase (FADH(2)-oxidizing) TrmFO, partial [Candidatus Eisenbacteria bacterium]